MTKKKTKARERKVATNGIVYMGNANVYVKTGIRANKQLYIKKKLYDSQVPTTCNNV